MRWKLIALLICFATAPAFGQVAEVDKVEAQKQSLLKNYGDKLDIRFDVPYANTDNPKQALDLYLPKQPNIKSPLPIVVFIHGGGWTNGDRKGYAFAAAKLAASGNYATASVGYRLSGEAQWPSQIYDCKAAIRWLRAHAEELNIDPNKIGATGGSAGGHLVTLLGVSGDVKALEGNLGENTAQSSRVTCVVNICGPTDLTAPLMQGAAAEQDDPAVSAFMGGPLKDKQAELKAASPLTYVSKDTVPILTFHGTKDPRVNFTNAEKLDAAMKQAGAVSILVPIIDGVHSVAKVPGLDERALEFWDMYLRDIHADISTKPIQAPVAEKQ